MEFSLGKIPVAIHPFFWLLVALISLINGQTPAEMGIWAVIVFCSILFHELGHALTAQWFGQKPRISLIMFGGVTERSGPKLKLWKEFIIVLNGPLAGFLLFFVTAYFSSFLKNSASLIAYGLDAAWRINLVWTILNLVPVQPLDGGRLLSILFEGLFGVRGIKIAFAISIALAFLASLFLFTLGAFWPGAIFLIIGFESLRGWKGSWSMTEEDRDDSIIELYKTAEQEIQEGKKAEALQKFRRIYQASSSGLLHAGATRYLAKELAEQDKHKEAYALLMSIKDHLNKEDFPDLQLLAYLSEDWKNALKFGEEAYRENPDYEIASLNALSYSRLKDADSSITWIHAAIRDGLPDLEEFLKNEDFDSIRTTPSFQELVKR